MIADQIPPWLLALSPEAREAVAATTAAWPPLSDRQRDRLRLLFRPRSKGGDAT